MPYGLVIFILYLIVILMLLVVLTVHELGHFLFAKFNKVNVKEFSIGFGPKLWWKHTKSGMRITLRLIPLMAYVIMDSKLLRSMYKGNRKNKNYALMMSAKPKGTHYLEDVKNWPYIQIMFGGVLLNLIAFFLVYIPVVCINPSFASTPFTSIGEGFVAIGNNMIFSKKAQGDIFGQVPALPSQLTTSMDWLGAFLGTFMMINLLAFVFNLLPLPPLDGWKITKQIFEKTTHKKINDKIEYWITIAIIILMLWIFISGIVNDIIR